jgi:hypothetical protein
MAVYLPNLDITVPSQGNRSWYDEFVALMTALDDAVSADTYMVPASAQHVEASMAALFDDLYSRYYTLATTTPTDVMVGADSIAAGGVQVIARI